MKTIRYYLALLLVLIAIQPGYSQDTPAQALTNVTLHNSDGSVTESATIVWRNGVIESVGTNTVIPFDAFVIDGGDSLHVYPGFIDGHTTIGSPDQPDNLRPLPEPGNPPYDRAGVQPERRPSILLTEDKDFENWIHSGFTTAGLGLKGYMLPGQLEVFMLSDSYESTGLYRESIGLVGSFSPAPGGWNSGAYPSTLMGVMAKFRQVMFDATALQDHIQYYEEDGSISAPERDRVLESMFPLVNNEKPLYFYTDSEDDIERLFRLQDQFGFSLVLISGEEAYKLTDELKERNISVLASLDLSEAPEWYTESKKESDDEADEDDSEEEEGSEISEEEQNYRERQLKAWMAEVKNIRILMDEGINVGFASNGTSIKDLKENVSVLLEEGGLSMEELLQYMTINTAEILGIESNFGSVKKGMNASFQIYSLPFTEEKAELLHTVSNGTIYNIQ
ncbi:amidohydrolase family protein [Balneola sp. MJW-20]|uniref:amidohydrolase family protein n=1 Tax=Gracilimonas aurantiaca TaxID=3234185 RepID=UPI003465BA1B